MNTNDLAIRPITGPEELGLFSRLPYVLNDELADDLAAGRRRPEWMWVALRGDRLLARAAWWSRSDGDAPFILDVVDIDDSAPGSGHVDIGVRLLRTAMAATVPDGAPRPVYSRFVPADWRESAVARRTVEDRMTVLVQTGAQLFVERLRLEWRPGSPVPEPSGRLRFRPVRDDQGEELVALMATALEGTLDAHSRDDLTRMSVHEAALRHYRDELARYASPRAWWRIATLPDGEPVGFVVPARNDYNAIIAYLAVLPSHRGHGYIDDLLAEGTRVLAEQEVPRIRASTDLGNHPMAKAFRRAGYVNFQREINMTWGLMIGSRAGGRHHAEPGAYCWPRDAARRARKSMPTGCSLRSALSRTCRSWPGRCDDWATASAPGRSTLTVSRCARRWWPRAGHRTGRTRPRGRSVRGPRRVPTRAVQPGAARRRAGHAGEMLAIGRAQAALSGESVVSGLGAWAAGLSEEGRYAEAADAMTELVAALLPGGSRSGALAWSLLEWIAALRDAGRSAEAADDGGPGACRAAMTRPSGP